MRYRCALRQRSVEGCGMGMLEEVAALLQAQSLGTLGTSMFLARLNDADVAAFAIGLFQAPGMGGMRIQESPGVKYQQPRLDVIVRGAANQFPQALARAQAIHDCLAAVNSQVLSGTYYLDIQPVTPPSDGGSDSHARPLVVCRFICTKIAS